MSIPFTIVNKFVHGGWHGLVKYEDYLLVDKNIISFEIGKGPSYLFILKNIKDNRFYKIKYTVIYKDSFYIPLKTIVEEPVEVFMEKKEIATYSTEQEISEEILNFYEQ